MRRFKFILPTLFYGAAWAQSGETREQVIDMATITVAHDLCGFDLSDAEEDAIAKRRQAIVDAGAMTAAEIGEIEAGLAVAMKQQVPEGLCKAGGAEAKLYRRKLDALGGE